METGTKNTLEHLVTEELSARVMGSGTLRVFATPAMIALIEETCWRSIADQLEDGQGTVGTLLNISHVAPTPLGMKVRCESELKEVDGRRLVFEVNVYDECGLIGKGTHERFIITEDKFQKKADAKKAE
jgi:fluoroacetyl-CoA thioesterase